MMKKLWVKHIAIPQDHGSWVFLLMPLVVGLVAGGSWKPAALFLILAAMAAFLLRQPVTIAVKAYSKRRAPGDLPPARFWSAIYMLLAAIGVIGLAALGFGYLMVLAVPGIPIFLWHLALVNRRQERRQVWVEMFGSGALALAAPAAYWVGRGQPDPQGWLLFILMWLQSAASIVYAYLRLDQRLLKAAPTVPERLRMAIPALAFTGLNVLIAIALSWAGWGPPLLALPYGLQFAESLYGSLINPAVGVKPTRIGIRQLIVSILFTIMFIVVWR